MTSGGNNFNNLPENQLTEVIHDFYCKMFIMTGQQILFRGPPCPPLAPALDRFILSLFFTSCSKPFHIRARMCILFSHSASFLMYMYTSQETK